MHFFGMLGLIGTISGGGALFYLMVHKLLFWDHDLIIEHGPLLVAAALFFLTGIMMFSTGLMGEILMRTYFESQGRRIYAVREIRTRREPQVADNAR
jgi:hypothetical protein